METHLPAQQGPHRAQYTGDHDTASRAGHRHSERVTPANFERLAEEAGLARPMMKRRVQELAEALVSKLPMVTTNHPVTLAVAKVIQSRCERKTRSFTA